MERAAGGSSLRQITVLDTEAREEAGALSIDGKGPGSARRHHFYAAPGGAASSVLGYGRCVAWSGPGHVLSPLPAAVGPLGQFGHHKKYKLETKTYPACRGHGRECVSFATITLLATLLWRPAGRSGQACWNERPAGPSFWQITADGTEARANAGALNFIGNGSGAARVIISVSH